MLNRRTCKSRREMCYFILEKCAKKINVCFSKLWSDLQPVLIQLKSEKMCYSLWIPSVEKDSSVFAFACFIEILFESIFQFRVEVLFQLRSLRRFLHVYQTDVLCNRKTEKTRKRDGNKQNGDDTCRCADFGSDAKYTRVDGDDRVRFALMYFSGNGDATSTQMWDKSKLQLSDIDYSRGSGVYF